MPRIGLRSAKVLCQMSLKERLAFIADGLPIILESALSFWTAAEAIRDRPREAEVLEGFSEEESAKILILADVVRCPTWVPSERIRQMVSWFYSHHARLLYAEAQSWQPVDVRQLQSYLDEQRKSHYIEDYMGNFIMPNFTVFCRESVMYADIVGYEDGTSGWNRPVGIQSALPSFKPKGLRVAEALNAIGAFTKKGLTALSEVWGNTEFSDSETGTDSDKLVRTFVNKCIADDLPLEHASDEHVHLLRRSWQMPMYNLDLSLIDVPLNVLERERQAMLWAAMQQNKPEWDH